MGHKISVSTLNCRELRTSYETVYEAVNTTQPDIMVMNETKLNYSMKWVTKKLMRTSQSTNTTATATAD
jgi:exonuclease III